MKRFAHGLSRACLLLLLASGVVLGGVLGGFAGDKGNDAGRGIAPTSVIAANPISANPIAANLIAANLASVNPGQPATRAVQPAQDPASGSVNPEARPARLIDASFFGMTLGATAPFPPPEVPIGAIGHPAQLAWATLEPQKGVFDFSSYDEQANLAAQHGLTFTITFAWTPSWAVADHTHCTGAICTSPPDNIQDWTDFVQAVINHYNGITAPHVRYYEVWNEADSAKFWTGTPEQLYPLAQAAYPIIHQDPNSLLFGPSLTGPIDKSINWITAYSQAAGGNLYADGISIHGYMSPPGFHPYPFPEDKGFLDIGSITNRVISFRNAFNRLGLAGKPMFDSEGSWGRANITDPDQQVAWLSRWYLLQAGTGAVQAVYWFAWGESNPALPPDQQWGLITELDQITPTRAGIAYGQVYNWLVGSIMSPCINSSKVWTCSLQRTGNYQGLAVWLYSTSETDTASYTPDPMYTQYRDLAGNVVPITGPVTIGPQPILLETRTP